MGLKAGLVRKLLGDSTTDLLAIINEFRRNVSCEAHLDNREQVIRTGCLSKFVELLKRDDNNSLQSESAWVLCNIAAFNDSQTQAVVSAGAVPALLRLMSSSSADVRLNAVWAISNIAGSKLGPRKVVFNHNAIKLLLPLLKDDSLGVVQNASWALYNLCSKEPQPPTFMQVAPCLSALADIISHDDFQVSLYACYALRDVAIIYGHLLLDYLPENFIATLHQVQKKFPGRRQWVDLTEVVENLISTNKSLTKDNVVNNKVECSSSKKRKTLVPGGVSTRLTPKRLKTSDLTTIDVPPKSWIQTRTRARQPLLSPPNDTSSCLANQKAELWSAVATGNMQKVIQMIQNTGPAVTEGCTGCTLLHVAADNSQPEVVEWLLQLLSPNLVNKAGLTPVHLAAMKGHTQVLRILLNDPHLDHLVRDTAGNTYRQLLLKPLFKAVLEGDLEHTRSLLGVGADPNMDGGRVVGGMLVRELQVTTARNLATTLHHNDIIHFFNKVQSSNCFKETNEVKVWDKILQNRDSHQVISGSNKQESNNRQEGYVTILTYGTFSDRPDLHLASSHRGAHNLASVFNKMGYNSHIHQDLTEQQTRQVLDNVRNMDDLDNVNCAIFVVVGHGTSRQQFLTSDGHLLDTQWLCRFFRDSQCPQLKNKPKLFIFDLSCGQYSEKGSGDNGYQNTRVDEPLRDIMCLYSNNGELTWYTPSRDGSPFNKSLCHTLEHHSHQELTDIYQHFLLHYTNMVSVAAPHLYNIGFNRKFYFTSSATSS